MDCKECIDYPNIRITINSENMEVPHCYLEKYDEEIDTCICLNKTLKKEKINEISIF